MTFFDFPDGEEPEGGDWQNEDDALPRLPISDDLQRMLDSRGIDNYTGVVVGDPYELPGELAGRRFLTEIEAIEYLAEAGILDFSDVVYFHDDEMYGVIIGDTGTA